MSLYGYDLLHQGALALSEIENNGIALDIDYLNSSKKVLKSKMDSMYKSLYSCKEYKVWKNKYGETMNLDSPDQMRDVLFGHFKYKSNKKTNKGLDSVDKSALKDIKKEFTDKILEIRKWNKLTSTYLNNFLREQWDGFIHPFFNLNNVTTFRGSSSNPNFQNIPKRDEEIMKYIRRAVVPRKDRMLVELDFSGLEVYVAACYHKDPVMIKDILAGDMHRDTAILCFMLQPDEYNSKTRYCAKNMFVFPQFYGDYFKDCAVALWNAMTTMKLEVKGEPMRDYLKSKGIKKYQDFEDHIKDVEEKFWNKYHVYRDWKNDFFEEYQRKGYVELYTGFKCRGVMKRNEAINYPIQGCAFHCLLYSLIKLHEWNKENGMKSMIVGQIHDSMVNDVHPEEYNEYLSKVKRVMTKEIAKDWDWITLPLKVSIDVCPMNEGWHKKKEVEYHICKVCTTNHIYKKKEDNGSTTWECPICGDKTNEFEKEAA